MDVLIILIPIGLLILIISFAAFFWTIRTNQYDDLNGAAQRILMDEENQTIDD